MNDMKTVWLCEILADAGMFGTWTFYKIFSTEQSAYADVCNGDFIIKKTTEGTEIHVPVVKGLYEKYRIREVTVNE